LAYFYPNLVAMATPLAPLIEISDSIFEFADPKNLAIRAKNSLISCTEIKSVLFGLFLPKFG